MFNISEKVVMITGANQNIGFSVAEGLAEMGAKVVVCDNNVSTSEKVINEFKERNFDFMWLQIDVSNKKSVDEAFDKVMERYGKLDTLVNNAGVRVNQTALEHDDDKWDWLFSINVKGVMLCSQAACKIMMKQDKGKIINISSISAFRGQNMRSSYCSSKGAVSSLTAALAVEWAQYGININAIAPGGVEIEHHGELTQGQLDTLSMTPLKRMAGKNDLLGPIAFLISDASNFITGQTIMVDGGWSIMGKPRR